MQEELADVKAQLAARERDEVAAAAAAAARSADASAGLGDSGPAAPGAATGQPSSSSSAPTVTLLTVILFGADGNLSKKKTYPALFALMRKQLLPADCLIIGYARQQFTTDEFRRKFIFRAVYDPAHPQRDRERFLSRCEYVSGQFDEADHFRSLRSFVEAKEREQEEQWCAVATQAAATKAARALLAKRPSQTENGSVMRQRQVSYSPLPWEEPGSHRVQLGDDSGPPTRASSSGELSPLALPGRITSFDDLRGGGGSVTPLMLPVPEGGDEADDTSSAGVDCSKVIFRHLRVYYLAVPPFLYGSICRSLRDAGMRRTSSRARGSDASGGSEDRFVLEKPFGRDLASYYEVMDW